MAALRQTRVRRPSSRRGSADVSRRVLERARQIRLLAFDCDGVLTDGTIWFFPAPTPEHADAVNEVKGFSAHDGIGFAIARRAGLKTAVITKRHSASLALRARDLRIDFVSQGIERKGAELDRILHACGLTRAQAAGMGDDLVDLPFLRGCGLAGAPANARPEVLAAADYVAPHAGGFGAARDFIEFILKAQGAWDRTVQDYLAAQDPEPEVRR